MSFRGLFIAYQLYRISYTGSLGLIFFTLFDVVVAWLTRNEYRKKTLDDGRRAALAHSEKLVQMPPACHHHGKSTGCV